MTQKKENDFAAEERCAKEVQLTSEQLERKAKKVEQHENMLKSMGVEQTKKPMKAAAGKEERTGKKIGISNPFVLTELILDKQIDWSNPQSEILIEETLESSYEDLIHKEDSVLLACQNDNPAIREEVDYDTVANVANTDQLHKLMGCKQLDVISSQKKGNKISLEVLIPEKREKALCSSLVSKYCCPVKLKKTKSSYSKPFIIGLRGFILSFFGKDVLPCFVGIFHKCDKIDVVHQRKTHHGDNLRECTVSLDAS